MATPREGGGRLLAHDEPAQAVEEELGAEPEAEERPGEQSSGGGEEDQGDGEEYPAGGEETARPVEVAEPTENGAPPADDDVVRIDAEPVAVEDVQPSG